MDVVWKLNLPDNLMKKFFRTTVKSAMMYDITAVTLTKILVA